MVSPSSDYALLLPDADAVTIELARDLLKGAGIPCYAHGPDFDFAELGRAAHDSVRHADVYVPKSALVRAKEVLEQAWGKFPGSGAGGDRPKK